MDANCIVRALGFHGQPLLKIWEDERGTGDLQKWGIPKELDFSVYQERQKDFTFSDRAKRLKLHQFIARNATELYDKAITRVPKRAGDTKSVAARLAASTHTVIMPPYEVFVGKHQDKIKHMHNILEGIKAGDVVYGIVTKSNTMYSSTPLFIKPLCTAEPLVRYLADIPIKAFVQLQSSTRSPPPDGRVTKSRIYAVNSYLRCEVIEISVDADRLSLSLENILTENVKLGSVSLEDLPDYYRKTKEIGTMSYEDCLMSSMEIQNPNEDILFEMNGLDIRDNYSMLTYFKDPFPPGTYAKELRQTQAGRWALRSVADGIGHFKEGDQVKAFQCLNHALLVDPRNVEGLVARGALYANKGSFLKAVEDFEMALKLNSHHANARKYMGETLVALGHAYEEDNHYEEAAKAYGDCINIIPDHQQAILSLKRVQSRLGVVAAALPIGTEEEEENPKRINRSVSRPRSVRSDHSHSSRMSAQSSYHSDSPRRTRHDSSQSSSNQVYNQPFFMSRGDSDDSGKFGRRSEDDTQQRVRKLLHEASKHKREKDRNIHKEEKNTDIKSELLQAVKALNDPVRERKLNAKLAEYEKSIAVIKKRQAQLRRNIAGTERRSESPTPSEPQANANASPKPSSSTAVHTHVGNNVDQAKFSFQIRKPVKIDKFGLVRIATPLAQKTPNTSRSSSRSRRRDSRSKSRNSSRYRSPTRSSRSHSRNRRRTRSRSRGRSYSRSSSSERRRDRRSMSRSKSPPYYRRTSSFRGRPYFKRRGGNGGGGPRRRTPSPFVPRGSPPSRRYRSRSRSPAPYRGRGGFKPGGYNSKFGNRIWHRQGHSDDRGRSGKINSRGRYKTYVNY